MKTLFPVYALLAFGLLIIQVYLLMYIALLLLRRVKILKQPYSGMDHAESFLAAIIILGVLTISSANAPGLSQAAKAYNDGQAPIVMPSFLFFTRSFLVVLAFSLVFIILNLINIRVWFRADYQTPNWPLSILLAVIAIGLSWVCWYACKEIVDDMAPKIFNFQ